MANFKAKHDIEDTAAQTPKEQRKKSGVVHNLTTHGSDGKTKAISAKVYPEAWESFTQINKARGMSSNSVLNMLICDYVRDNQSILG